MKRALVLIRPRLGFIRGQRPQYRSIKPTYQHHSTALYSANTTRACPLLHPRFYPLTSPKSLKSPTPLLRIIKLPRRSGSSPLMHLPSICMQNCAYKNSSAASGCARAQTGMRRRKLDFLCEHWLPALGGGRWGTIRPTEFISIFSFVHCAAADGLGRCNPL